MMLKNDVRFLVSIVAKAASNAVVMLFL